MVGDVAAAVAGVRMTCCLRAVRTDADAVFRSFVKERGPRVRVVLIVDSFGAVVVVGVELLSRCCVVRDGDCLARGVDGRDSARSCAVSAGSEFAYRRAQPGLFTCGAVHKVRVGRALDLCSWCRVFCCGVAS